MLQTNIPAPQGKHTSKILTAVVVINFVVLYSIGGVANLNYFEIRDSFTYKAENWIFLLVTIVAVLAFYFVKNRPKGKNLVILTAFILIIVSVFGLKDAHDINNSSVAFYKEVAVKETELPGFDLTEPASTEQVNTDVTQAVNTLYASYGLMATANLIVVGVLFKKSTA